MTFNFKSQDGETLRNLVKNAHDKGIFKEESRISKIMKAAATAKPAVDLTPSDNVQENLLKLCSGLRERGFAAYAAKVEDRIAQLKVADVHMYDVHGETGEDLLEFAHPEGSVEVAEAEGDNGVVEDKLDEQKKLIEIVQKSAASTKKAEVIEQVKLALRGPGTSFLVSEAAPTAEAGAAYAAIVDSIKDRLGQLVQVFGTKGVAGDPGVKSLTKQVQEVFIPSLDIIKREALEGKADTIPQFLNAFRKFQGYFTTSKQAGTFDTVIFKDDDTSLVAIEMLQGIYKDLESISWSIQKGGTWAPPSDDKDKVSFKNPGKWQETQKVVEPKKEQDQLANNVILESSTQEFKVVVATMMSKFNTILGQEVKLYEPIPDSDTTKIETFDMAFDRTETSAKDLGALYKQLEAIKEVKITKGQLTDMCKSLPTFRGKSSFNSKAELITYLDAIYKSVVKALGLSV